MEEDHEFRSDLHWRKMVIERESRARRLRLYLSALAALMALVGSFITILALSKNPRPKDIVVTDDFASAQDVIKITQDLDKIRASVDRLGSALDALQTPVPESTLAARQKEIAGDVESIEKRIQSLESALVESPDKALAVPLMRKDISDLDLRFKDGRIASKAEFDRLYSQQTWMLSGIGTVLLAVAGASLTMFIKSLPKPQTAEQDASSNGG